MSTPVTRLPRLNALRAFECAGRHLSFRLAAEELRVTAGAISQQIRMLEADLGVPLFERLPRGVRLTSFGERLLPATMRAMKMLADTTEQVRSTKNVLQVTVAPTLCTRWLVPRLGRFYDRHPYVEVRIDATTSVVDFATATFDVAIRFLASPTRNLKHEMMFADDIFPVCSPSLARALDGDPLRLKDCRLLSWTTHDRWSDWLNEAGVDVPMRPDRLQFSHLMLALDAAIAGQGVALTSAPLVQYDLESGRLVRPFKPVFRTGFAYYVAARPETLELEHVHAFVNWVTAEARH
jgi:LysR family glycine cleavage system transcriptional activator